MCSHRTNLNLWLDIERHPDLQECLASTKFIMKQDLKLLCNTPCIQIFVRLENELENDRYFNCMMTLKKEEDTKYKITKCSMKQNSSMRGVSCQYPHLSREDDEYQEVREVESSIPKKSSKFVNLSRLRNSILHTCLKENKLDPYKELWETVKTKKEIPSE